MQQLSLENVLKECTKSADKGYSIANNQLKQLRNNLRDAEIKIRDTSFELKSSPYYVAEATSTLTEQLDTIGYSFANLTSSVVEDLENLRQRQDPFSIALFGRTMTGKSTLSEILRQGDGSTIGKGKPRTTREPTDYYWNGLKITDLPGIGAVGGEEDNNLALEAAKSADLVLFLIKSVGMQLAEAEFFSKVVNFGKPIICINNVRASIKFEDIEQGIIDIEESYDPVKLQQTKNQFCSFAKNFGQDWSNIPFVFVHLKSAYMAQNKLHPEYKDRLLEVSRINELTSRIIMEVWKKGNFYCIKTFLDCISTPLRGDMELLLQQGTENSEQGRIVINKQKQLRIWGNTKEDVFERKIKLFVKSKNGLLKQEVSTFAEDYCSNENADGEWKKLVASKTIEQECERLLESIDNECREKVSDIAREIEAELRFLLPSFSNSNLNMHRIVDFKRKWDWGCTIATTVLAGGGIVAEVLGAAAVAKYFGLAGLAIGLVGAAVSYKLKSYGKKEADARSKMSRELNDWIDETCDSLEKQLDIAFHDILSERIEKPAKELDRLCSTIFLLADTQKKLAWELADNLLELNKKLVVEALHTLGVFDYDDSFVAVGRVPGTILLVIRKDVIIPAYVKSELKKLLRENIRYVPETPNTRLLLSKILGNAVNYHDISIEGKTQTAHVHINQISPELRFNFQLAQQLTKLVISER